MLERVETILQHWEKEGVEAALSLNLNLPTPQELSQPLAALSDDDRRALIARLDDFAKAVIAFQVKATSDMQSIIQELERAKSAAEACMSYASRHKDS